MAKKARTKEMKVEVVTDKRYSDAELRSSFTNKKVAEQLIALRDKMEKRNGR